MTNHTSDPNDHNNESLEVDSEVYEELVTIGKYLRFERDMRQVSLKVVSQHTKISLTMLTYLENEDYDKLPDLAYVRGFVKNYSKALGISTPAALEVLEDTYNFLNKESIDINTHAESLQNPEPIDSGTNLKLIGVIAIVIAFVAIIATMTRSNKVVDNQVLAKNEITPKPTPQVTPNNIRPTTLSLDTPLSKVKPIIPKLAKVVPTATIAPVQTPVVKVVDIDNKQNEKKTEDGEDKEKEEKKEIKFQTLSRNLYSYADNSEEALTKFVPEEFRNSIVSGKQNLFIAVKDGDTWITYKVDQKPVKKIILRDGSQLNVIGDEITAFLGNVHVTKIFLNNKLLDIVSRSGVKSLIFPQDKRDKHKYPLFIYNEDGSVTSSFEYIKMKKNQAIKEN
jgi:cytoskeleton protein RodZ